MSKDTPSKRDQEVAESAEREASAQLEIVRALKPLSQKSRQQVMEVVKLLLEADELMPGIMTALGRGLAPPATLDQAQAAGPAHRNHAARAQPSRSDP